MVPLKIIERVFSPSDAFSLVKEGIHPVLAKVLAARGVSAAKQAAGGLDSLIPYTELANAIEMAAIIADAIESKKRLLIVADYDADGATACSVGVRALKAFGANVGYIVPDRVVHGYGLTPAIANIACNQTPKPDYIITVDNGIAANAGIEECMRLGVPVLVTDHHLPGDVPPPALCIVNPNQIGCTFPSKALAGCGAIFYVMWALQDELIARGYGGMSPGFNVFDLLPIVALGTVADVVALDDNNRILVKEGIELIRKNGGFPGIEALAKVAGRDVKKMATSDFAFALGPRINAAGRLESMNAGIDCLTSDDANEALQLATAMHEINDRRKAIESDMTDEAVRQLITTVKEGRYTAALYSKEWHQGVIGIVAGRIKEKIWRPTFVLADGDKGSLKGSGRSIPGFHLRDALDLVDRRHPGLLLKFGGHAMAAGVTVRAGGLEEFSDAFEAVAHELLSASDLNQVLEVDGALDVSEMNEVTVAALKEQVWGQSFPEPAFCDVFSVVDARAIGGGNHLKLTLEKDGRRFGAVKFRHADGLPPQKVRAVYKMDLNTFKNMTNLQLLVEHLEAA